MDIPVWQCPPPLCCALLALLPRGLWFLPSTRQDSSSQLHPRSPSIVPHAPMSKRTLSPSAPNLPLPGNTVILPSPQARNLGLTLDPSLPLSPPRTLLLLPQYVSQTMTSLHAHQPVLSSDPLLRVPEHKPPICPHTFHTTHTPATHLSNHPPTIYSPPDSSSTPPFIHSTNPSPIFTEAATVPSHCAGLYHTTMP